MTNTGVERREAGWIPDVSTLGARLALVRHAMGWNIAEAATNCGLPVASWRNWESRGKEPRGLLNVALKIAGVTGVDYRWLALGPEVPSTSSTEDDAGVTHGYPQYHALGERLISTTPFVQKFERTASARWSDVRACVRTRPLGR